MESGFEARRRGPPGRVFATMMAVFPTFIQDGATSYTNKKKVMVEAGFEL